MTHPGFSHVPPSSSSSSSSATGRRRRRRQLVPQQQAWLWGEGRPGREGGVRESWAGDGAVAQRDAASLAGEDAVKLTDVLIRLLHTHTHTHTHTLE